MIDCATPLRSSGNGWSGPCTQSPSPTGFAYVVAQRFNGECPFAFSNVSPCQNAGAVRFGSMTDDRADISTEMMSPAGVYGRNRWADSASRGVSSAGEPMSALLHAGILNPEKPGKLDQDQKISGPATARHEKPRPMEVGRGFSQGG